MGDVGVYAFYRNKQITTGESGAVVTNNSATASKVRKLRNQGRNDSEEWFQHSELGYNCRISDINCAPGVAQLKRIDSILDRRESIAREYGRILVGNPDSMLPPMALPNRKISWFVYVVRLSSRFREFHRDRIVNEMKFREIALGEILCADSPTASLSIVRRREGYSACDGVSRVSCARAPILQSDSGEGNQGGLPNVDRVDAIEPNG